MPQFALSTVVCRTRVLFAARAEYRVSSVLSDEGLLSEDQGCRYSKKMKTVDTSITPLRGIFPLLGKK